MTRAHRRELLLDVVRRLRQTGGRGRKLRGLLVLLKPYRKRVILMLVALVAATAAALAPAPLAKVAIDDGIKRGDLGTLNLVVIAFVASALVVWAATYVQTYLVGWVGQRALQDLRLRIFEHLQSQPIGFYERRQAGALISRMTNDVQALDQLVTDSVVTLFSSTLTLVGTVAILAWLDLELAALILCPEPVNQADKELVSAHTARLCANLHLDAAIATKEGGGNADADVSLKLDRLEEEGITAVGILAEMAGRDGTGPPLVVPPTKATALISTGNYDERMTLPAVQRALGRDRVALLDQPSTDDLELPVAAIYCAQSTLGWGRLTCAEAV